MMSIVSKNPMAKGIISERIPAHDLPRSNVLLFTEFEMVSRSVPASFSPDIRLYDRKMASKLKRTLTTKVKSMNVNPGSTNVSGLVSLLLFNLR